ncbi:polysaccharide pyruvyl transferase family protein [Lentibacillus sp. N15]|uniref:polysaccharide pyruvyl transferase family protein n=1 Tax=Lentibacillus songyuanensis TaxID=3136161 RepID=UPI0031BB2B98
MKSNILRHAKNSLAYLSKDIFVLNNPRQLVKQNQVNLHWFSMKRKDGTENLGDWLSTVIYENMLRMNNIKPDQKVKHTKHIYSVGSILGFGYHNATIWGSGLLSDQHTGRLRNVSLDVRSVRGPETRRVLIDKGFKCPNVYGDPAILLPFFYKPNYKQKNRKYSIILHYSSLYKDEVSKDESLNILTKDYKSFIDTIVQSEVVISSSLHGIILAEAYGVPAILLNDRKSFDLFKYKDYYYSTNRTTFNVANTIEEALVLEPNQLPNLKKLQEGVIKAFPRDLWIEK